MSKKFPRRQLPHNYIIAGAVILLLAGFVVSMNTAPDNEIDNAASKSTTGILLPMKKSPLQALNIRQTTQPAVQKNTNPLSGKRFYIDTTRDVSKLYASYLAAGNKTDADIINRIASQPGTTWLIGPTASDLTARRDIGLVLRTSSEAATQGTVPIYELYAVPKRDACAGYSQGGFVSNAEYLAWVDGLLSSLKTPAVFAVEADAVGHMVAGQCMTASDIDARQSLLRDTLTKLHAHQRVIASYLDAGNPEWFPNTDVLVDTLKKSGVDTADGIAVNTSNFVSTSIVTDWSKGLVDRIGGSKGVIIDTSRNGQGAVDASVTGDARWCNPPGRGIGLAPTTKVTAAHVHAYVWLKTTGESDGACYGNPPAGTFSPDLAMELARNAQ